MQIYLVGGAVRDQLLGLPVQDRDWVVVGATPEALLAQGFIAVGKDFPVFLHPHSGEEYALARTERKTAPGYTGFQCYAAADVSLEEDLKRRDLTINAMAQDAQGQLFDPFGGQQDLQAGWLRHVSVAFAEDPVRILRLARFAARYAGRGFRVAAETLQLMQEMVTAGEVNALVAERVWAEMVKALAEPDPGQFFVVLQQVGALPRILPELAPVFACGSSESRLLAVLAMLAQQTTEPLLRFTALAQVLDKAGLAALCRRLRIPNDYQQLAALVLSFYPHYAQGLTYSAEQRLLQLEQADAFRRPQRFQQGLQVCQSIDFIPEHLALTAGWSRDLQAAQQVDTQALIQQGLQGPAFGQALHQQRTRAMDQ